MECTRDQHLRSTVLEAQARADAINDDEDDGMILEGTAQLRARCAVYVVAFAL
jgi:hypothetical protein